MLKFLSILITVILLIALQIGFLPGLNHNLILLINLPLLFIVFLAFFSDYETSLTAALLLGLFLDLYSQLFFGFFIILLIIEVILIKFFILHVLQNRRLRALLFINLIAIFAWQLIYFIALFITSRLTNLSLDNFLGSQYFIYSTYQLFIHSLIILILSKSLPRFKANLSSNLIP
jgi:cell shape-determining protein MreD